MSITRPGSVILPPVMEWRIVWTDEDTRIVAREDNEVFVVEVRSKDALGGIRWTEHNSIDLRMWSDKNELFQKVLLEFEDTKKQLAYVVPGEPAGYGHAV